MKFITSFLTLFLFFILNNSFSQEWHWISSHHVNFSGKMDFVDDQYGFMLGRGGSFHTTVDGGLTWNFYPIKLPFKPVALSFLDPMEGWICGQEGFIAHTLDGGKSWTEQVSNTTQLLNGIFFLDNMNGWAVGGGGKVVKTVNGGNTWRELNGLNTNLLHDVEFVNAQEGWICGIRGTIAKTIDGGFNWVLNRPAGATADMYDVSFTDENNGWFVGRTGRVHQTTDGGQSWIDHTRGGGNTSDLYAVDFADSLSGWIVGARSEVRTTSDGGQTWTYYPSFIFSTFRGVNAFSDQHAFVSNGQMTFDGGVSWDTVVKVDAPRTFDFQTAEKGWMAKTVDEMFKTTDGGCSWTEFPVNLPDMPTQTTVNSIAGYDSTIIFGTFFRGIIGYSNDGGLTWGLQDLSTRSANVENIILFNDSIGYLKVDNVYKTTDGGTNWTTIGPGFFTGTDPFDMYFSSPDTGWVTYNRTVYYTSDSGGSWTALSSLPGGYRPTAIYFFNENEGYAGSSNILFHTIDGGTTWSPDTLFARTSLSPGGISDIVFIDALNGWVVGENNTALVTEDGGQTWQPFSRYDNTANVKIQMFSKDLGYLGKNGILKYSVDPAPYFRSIEVPLCPNPLVLGQTTISEVGVYKYVFESCDTITTVKVIEGTELNPVIEASSTELKATEMFSAYQWYRNDTLIEGATNQTYIPTQSGNYYLIAFDEASCSGTSDTLAFFISGLEQLRDPSFLKVFPNPASQKITIQLQTDFFSSYNLELRDLLGQRVFQKKNISRKEFTLDINHLPTGQYFIKCFNDQVFIMKPIWIN